MTGGERKLVAVMEGADKRFVIPVYQRSYDWRKEQCKQLYDDLVMVIKNQKPSHFFGSIVASNKEKGSINEQCIIDGQQRLTTVSLLMLAMCDLMKEGKLVPKNPSLTEKIYESYLIDKYNVGESSIKLRPVKADRDAYQRLFSEDEERIAESNVTVNYDYFYQRIQRQEIGIDELFEAIKRLEIIFISLHRDDDPQRIFESLNATGLALSEGDKIRNFILMGLDSEKQNEYYEKYWNKIELCTGNDVGAFVRNYLSVKQQIIPVEKRVYAEFKEYVNAQESLETEALLRDLLDYARLYERLTKGKTEDRQLNACIYRLNRLESTVTRPFLLEVLRMMKSDDSPLSIDEARQIFLITEHYLVRRIFCDLPTNALNKIFLTLHRDIVKYDGSAANYLEKFKYALLSKTGNGRFPSDDEFAEAVGTRDVFLMNPKNKTYILERVENYGIDEDKDIYRHLEDGTYSIEHVMPQTPTNQWAEALGDDWEEIHKIWLHRLANLTLTAYNSEYRNRSFAMKRDMEKGFRQSGLRMNAWIAQQEKWTLDELEARSEMLAERAVHSIWPLPETDYKPAEKQLESCSLEDDVDLSGRDVARFAFRSGEQPVKSWIDLMEQVVKQLHEEDASVLPRIAHAPREDGELSVYVSDDPTQLHSALEIEKGIYIEKNTSTNTKLTLLRKLFKAFGQNPEELIFYLRDKAAGGEDDAAGSRIELRRRYWSLALEYIRSAHGSEGAFSKVNPSKSCYLSGGIGISGFNITCDAKIKNIAVDLVLAKSSRDANKSAYDFLHARKDEIEAALGGISLNWWRFDGKASYVDHHIDGIGIDDENNWPRMAKFHAEWSKKFYDVFVPLLMEWSAQER